MNAQLILNDFCSITDLSSACHFADRMRQSVHTDLSLMISSTGRLDI